MLIGGETGWCNTMSLGFRAEGIGSMVGPAFEPPGEWVCRFQLTESHLGWSAPRVEGEGLGERFPGGVVESHRGLALTEEEPEAWGTGIELGRLLEQFQSGSKLFPEGADTGAEPAYEPIARSDLEGAIKAGIHLALLAGEQDVAPGEPDQWKIPGLIHGGIRKGHGDVQLSQSSQGHGFHGEELGIVGKPFQGFVGPDLGFPCLVQFQQGETLAGPGEDIVGIVLQGSGIPTEGGLKFGAFERGPGLIGAAGFLGCGRRFLNALGAGFMVELKVSEAAHGTKTSWVMALGPREVWSVT